MHFMGFKLIYWTPTCSEYFLEGSLFLENVENGRIGDYRVIKPTIDILFVICSLQVITIYQGP